MLSTLRRWLAPAMLLGIIVALAACVPAAAPTPTATKPASAVPTRAAEPAKVAEPTKPPVTSAPAATATPRPASLKIGSIQALSDAGVYVAIEKGYFKEQGITMEVVNFRTTGEMVAPLGTGQLDIMATSLSTALLTAADRGVDLKIVADKGQSMPNWEWIWLLLRKDLADSGQIKTGADLKGMKVAVPGLASIAEQVVETLMQQSGAKPGDVDALVLPYADQAAAFANKGIAAGYTGEPSITQAVQQGLAVKWMPVSKFFDGRGQTGAIVYGPALIKDQDLGRRWMIAYLKGIRDYTKAFTTKEGRQQIVDVLVKYTPVKDPKLYDVMEMAYLDPNGTPDRKSMDAQYKWIAGKGIYTGKTTFNDILDQSYSEFATQKLGKQ